MGWKVQPTRQVILEDVRINAKNRYYLTSLLFSSILFYLFSSPLLSCPVLSSSLPFSFVSFPPSPIYCLHFLFSFLLMLHSILSLFSSDLHPSPAFVLFSLLCSLLLFSSLYFFLFFSSSLPFSSLIYPFLLL